MSHPFTFYTTRGNSVNWTEHCFHKGLVVLEREIGGQWYLLRKKSCEPLQRIPLRSVPDRVENAVSWFGKVYLNNRTGKCSEFSMDVRGKATQFSRTSTRTVTRTVHHHSDTADAAVAGAVAGLLVGALLSK